MGSSVNILSKYFKSKLSSSSGTNGGLISFFKYLSQFISIKYSCDLILLKPFSPLPKRLLGSKFNNSFIKLIKIRFKSGGY